MQQLVDPLRRAGPLALVAHPEIGTDAQDIPFLPRFQPGQEVGVVAISRIGHHTLMRHAPGPGLIEQCQGDLRLGLKGQLRRYSGVLPALGVLRPHSRQVQPYRHWPRGLEVRVTTGHRELAVAHFAQRPRVLARHPDRGLPLLGKARIIQHQDTVAQGGFSIILPTR